MQNFEVMDRICEAISSFEGLGQGLALLRSVGEVTSEYADVPSFSSPRDLADFATRDMGLTRLAAAIRTDLCGIGGGGCNKREVEEERE